MSPKIRNQNLTGKLKVMAQRSRTDTAREGQLVGITTRVLEVVNTVVESLY